MNPRSPRPEPTHGNSTEALPSLPSGRRRKTLGVLGPARVPVIFVSTVAAAFLIGGERLGGRYGLLFGFFASLALALLVFLYSRLRLAELFPSRLLEGRDAWGVRARLEAIAGRLGVPAPPASCFNHPSPAAYSIGAARWDSMILLSRGLLESFSSQELDMVLLHETLRIARHDSSRLTLAAALAALLLALGRLVDLPFAPLALLSAGAVGNKGRGRLSRAPRPGTALVAPLIAALQAPFDRPSRCFERDREAAALSGDPQAYARVLWKLAQYSMTRPISAAPSEAPLFMVNPLTGASWYRYFVRQPRAEARIRRLTGQFPL